MLKLDNKTKIIIGIVVLGIVIFYFLKTDETTDNSKVTTLMRALSGQEKSVIMTDSNGNMSTSGVGKIDELKVGNNIELRNDGALVIDTPQGGTAFNDMRQTNSNGTKGLNFMKGDLIVENSAITHGKFKTLRGPNKQAGDRDQMFIINNRNGSETIFDYFKDNQNYIRGQTNFENNVNIKGNSLIIGQWEFRTCEIQPDQGGGAFLQILYKDQPIAKFGSNSVFSVGTNVEDRGRDDWRAWRNKKCP